LHPLLLERLEERALLSVLTVNTVADNTSDTSVLTLRDAITLVNNGGDPTALGQPTMPAGWAAQIDSSAGGFGTNDTIDFNIPGTGVHTIEPGSVLPTVTQPVVIDGYSQPGARRNTLAVGDDAVLTIELDGSITGPNNGAGLIVSADNSAVQGLAINRFASAGIILYGADRVQGCFIGTDASGTVALGNGYVYPYAGVQANTGGALIGIDGNGIDETGGGLNEYTERNIISGNTVGVSAGSPAGVAVVAGNYIGTDRTGTHALPNSGSGVEAGPGSRVGVDGQHADPDAERNVISGNLGSGVVASAGVVVAGNFIGTDATGTQPLGNSIVGIFALGGALIGTAGNDGVIGDGAERNVISANDQQGIYVTGQNNQIAGNFIGTNFEGSAAVGAQPIGVFIDGNGTNNHIGLDPADSSLDPADKRNVISGNAYANVQINGSGNTVAGNYIGLDAAGTSGLFSGRDGILFNGGSDNLIGTEGGGVNDDLERNVISGNLTNGIEITQGDDNVIAGNYIGTDWTGTTITNLGNGQFYGSGESGILMNYITSGNQIVQNVIAGSWAGVRLLGTGVSDNVVAGNYIGTDRTGRVALGNTAGVDLFDSPSNTIGGMTPPERNLISGNGVGVYIQGIATGNEVLGNWIGTDATGSGPLGNGTGVGIADSASLNQIGGTAPGQGNTIAFNGGGVTFFGTNITASGDSIRGNSIHDNAGLGIDLGADGVTLNGSHSAGGPGPNNWQTFPVLIDLLSEHVKFRTGLDLHGHGDGQLGIGHAHRQRRFPRHHDG